MTARGTAVERRRRMLAESRRLVAEGKLSVAYSAELLERSSVILADAGRTRTGPVRRQMRPW